MYVFIYLFTNVVRSSLVVKPQMRNESEMMWGKANVV